MRRVRVVPSQPMPDRTVAYVMSGVLGGCGVAMAGIVAVLAWDGEMLAAVVTAIPTSALAGLAAEVWASR